MLPLVVIAALAAALRLWNLRHGLPDFLEEAIPFRKALEMWRPDGSTDWNPRLFHYPSLSIYLQLLIQKLHYATGRLLGEYSGVADYLVSYHADPTPMVVRARLLGVAGDAIAVLLVARIGERLRRGAGWLAALAVACAPTLIGSSRSIFTDSVMVIWVVAALERMLAYRESGGAWRLAGAAALIGLAAGSKYPGAVLLLPLGFVLWLRHGAPGIGLWVASSAVALAVFLVTTPFALLDFTTFVRDFEFVGRLGVEGHLGNIEGAGFAFHLRNLARDLGWVGVLMLSISLILAVARAARRHEALVVWLALLCFAVPISFAHVLAERYLAPVVPLAASLIAAAAVEILGLLPARARPAGWAAVVALIATPPLVAGVRAGAAGGTSTRIEARRWVEAHLTRDDLLVQEFYGAAVLSRQESFAIQARPFFQAARPQVRERFRRRPWRSSVTIPLAVVGRPVALLRPPGGPPVEVQVFSHVADLNQICYDARLFAGVDYVLTSSAVRGRYHADTVRFAVQNRFYHLLDSTAEVVARFAPREAGSDPEIVIYRLGAAAREAIARLGPLDPLGWAEFVPRDYRLRAEALLLPPERRGDLAARGLDGQAAAWARSLGGFYQTRFAPFARAMSMELMEHGRHDLARRFAATILAVQPGDVGACLMYSTSSRSLGAWRDARSALERSIAWLTESGEPSGFLRLEYADVLAHEGEVERARGELERLLSSDDRYLAGEAERRLADAAGPFGVR